jgi:hypothetical protein
MIFKSIQKLKSVNFLSASGTPNRYSREFVMRAAVRSSVVAVAVHRPPVDAGAQ